MNNNNKRKKYIIKIEIQRIELETLKKNIYYNLIN